MHYLLLCGGTALLIVAVKLLITFLKVKKNRAHIQANIVVVESWCSEDVMIYKPIVSFHSHHPQSITHESGVVTRSADKYKVGDKMDVFYNPNNPNDFIAYNPQVRLLTVIAIAAIGIILIISGLII